MEALAPEPTRSSNSITLAWGLVTIPLSVYTGTEATSISRSEFIQDGETLVPVGRSPIRKDNGEVVEQTDVVRMAQADSGEWVTLTDAEAAACTTEKGLAQIEAFVPVKDMGEYLTEDMAQVRPKRSKGKTDPAAAKAFALLITAMGKRKVAALVKVAMRGPARYALLTADGSLRYVKTHDAIRQPLALAKNFAFTPAEVDMAITLIDKVVGVDTPVLTDETAPQVQAFVNSKATGAPQPDPAIPAPIPGDLMDSLMASVQAAEAARKGEAA
jgi:DNA end-binding protein Ku